jgi:hypothetical protein
MSLFRRKPAEAPVDGPSWASHGTAKHTRSEPGPTNATDPVPPAAATHRGSHRASPSPVAPVATADQV